MNPPNPPKPSITSDNATARTIGSFHGNAPIHPRSPRPPRARPAISRPAHIEKTVSKVGRATKNVRKPWRNLKPPPIWGSANRWCAPTGTAEDKKHDKGEPPHRVAVEASTGRLRGQRVISDVGRHQPKVDDRVQGHRKQSAPEARVNLRRPAKGRRQDDAQQLDDDPAGRPSPQQ